MLESRREHYRGFAAYATSADAWLEKQLSDAPQPLAWASSTLPSVGRCPTAAKAALCSHGGALSGAPSAEIASKTAGIVSGGTPTQAKSTQAPGGTAAAHIRRGSSADQRAGSDASQSGTLNRLEQWGPATLTNTPTAS